MGGRIAVPELSSRDRRTLLRGAAVIAAVLFLAKGVPAWRRWREETGAAAQELAADAQQAETLLKTMPALRDSLRVRSARLQSLAPTIVPGDTPGSAAAALASLVGDAAGDAGVTLGGLEPRADTAEATLGAARSRTSSPFVRVSVHGQMTGDIVSIMQFLANIEHGPTILAIRELSITQAEPAASTTHMETLHGDVTVVGLARGTPSNKESQRAVVPVGSEVAPGSRVASAPRSSGGATQPADRRTEGQQ